MRVEVDLCYTGWRCGHLSVVEASLVPPHVRTQQPMRVASCHIWCLAGWYRRPLVPKASLLSLMPVLSRPREWREAIFGVYLVGIDVLSFQSIFITLSCPFLAAHKSGAAPYLVSAWLGLTSCRFKRTFTTPSCPCSAAHDSVPNRPGAPHGRRG